jgi:hypothetical protein
MRTRPRRRMSLDMGTKFESRPGVGVTSDWEEGMQRVVDEWFSEGWGLVGLRCLLVFLTIIVIGSLLSRIIVVLGGRRQRWRAVGQSHARVDSGSFEGTLEGKRRTGREGMVVGDGVIGAPDVGDTCGLM